VIHPGRFPFDKKSPFGISKILRVKWDSKSGRFPVGYASPGGPNRSVQFRTGIFRIYGREVLETGIFRDFWLNGKRPRLSLATSPSWNDKLTMPDRVAS